MADERLDSLERARGEEDEYKRLEGRWKSDVDLKLDRLIKFAEKNEGFLGLLMDREIARKKLRDALIEKTLGAILLGGVLAVGAAVWSYIKMNVK